MPLPYSATAYRLLISSPSDVAEDDTAAVMESAARWNAIYGQQFGAVVVPTHWSAHSTAEHGTRPQAVLNEQLVDKADIVIALFWHRLGSPTGESESGTVEEIEEAHSNGAYVAVLRCVRDVPPNALDAGQLEQLQAFLKSVEGESLILSYTDTGTLAQHVDQILGRAISQSATRAQAVAELPTAEAEVWPRIESRENVKTDSRGRVKTERKWRLVLTNTGDTPALNVEHRFEQENPEDTLPHELGNDRPLEVLPPGGDASYPIVLHMGVTDQARCVVTWSNSAGEAHENAATLRFF